MKGTESCKFVRVEQMSEPIMVCGEALQQIMIEIVIIALWCS
jgi:hypothetical protein